MSCATTIVTVAVPGPPGASGAPGAPGLNGASAFTLTTAPFTLPLKGVIVTVSVVSSAGFASGQTVYVTVGGALAYMQVVSAPSSLTLTLLNLEDSATGAYALNSPPDTIFATGASVAPSGPQGPPGVNSITPGTYLEVAQNLADLDDSGTARLNLGLGSAALYAVGVSDGQVPLIDGAFTTSQLLFATSNGLRTLDAPSARTQIGLGTSAVLNTGVADNLLPQVDDAAGLANGEVIFATANGLESKDAASARAALGITNPSGGALDMLLFQHRVATTTPGGSFAPGSPQDVPLNVEVIDTGNRGSIAGFQVTLAAGTYRYRFGVTGYEVGTLQGFLYNLTTPGIILNAGGTIPSYGSAAQSGATLSLAGTSNTSLGEGRFTLSVSTTLALRAQCSVGRVVYGFGLPTSFGGDEVYSWLELYRE